MKTFPITIAIARIKCLGTNLTKEGRDLYTENSNTLMKETKEDTDKLKAIPHSCIGRIMDKYGHC